MAARSPEEVRTSGGTMNSSAATHEGETTLRGDAGGCGLADNLDVMICRAEWLHYLGAYQASSLKQL